MKFAVIMPESLQMSRLVMSVVNAAMGGLKGTGESKSLVSNTLHLSQGNSVRAGRGGLVISTLDTGASGLGSSPVGDIVLCSWARHFILRVPLSGG